ncbi:autotransporter outer membrane beta-barrel domain-containing protein [Pandoraea communis]|nr:autotransporter domain-containing protein [Pandoraea communis]
MKILSKEKMGRSKKQPRFTAGDQTCLALSLTAAFATMVSAPAKAATVTGSATVVGATTNVSWNGSGTLVINSGVLVTGTPALNVSTTNGILQNNGTLSGSAAVSNTGLITTLNNGNGTVIGSSITGATGIDNALNGTITTLHNFSGSRITAITGIKNSGTIGTLTNDSGGSISNGGTGIFNYSGGTIGTLSNSGLISQAAFGINNNNATITTLQNAGGTINGVTAIQNNNNGSIGTLTNTGFINANSAGIANLGNSSIAVLNNGGLISAQTAISNAAAIGTLTNTGTIKGTQAAISNIGTIGVIANDGGVISGKIANTTQPLSLTGGSGTTFGTLTGAGSGIGAGNIGLITNTASSLTFGAGNQLLNDHINVGGNTVFNAGGTLQVNNAITITGNYSQNAGATLNIGVADGAVATGVASADSGYGRLIVSGVATLNAGANIALKKLNSYGFAQGQRFVVAQAGHANTNYNAGSLNYSADGYTGTYSGASVVDSDDNTKTDLVVTLAAPATGTNPGGNSPGSIPGGISPGSSPGATSPIMRATTPDAISALSGLFRYGGTNAGMLNMFNAAAALNSAGDANRAGAQLSPASITASAVQSAQTTTQAVLNITASRIDTLRTAQSAGSGVSTGESANDIALWGQAFGGQANQGNRSGASGYRASYGGLLIGADTALNDAWRVGGVFNYADTSVDGRDDNTGSSARIKGYGLTGYGGYTAERWYLNLAGGIVWQKYDTHRSVDYTGFSGNAAGRFNGTQYIASAQAGYPIKLDAVTTFTPIVGLSYSRMTQDAYTETGGVAALRVNSSNASSVKSELGAKLARTFTTSYGEITPSIQLSWRHEYLDTSIQSIANFAADTSGATSFMTQGALANRDTGVMVLGVTLARSQNLTLAARYTLEASRGYTAQTADLRLRYQF